MCLWEGNSGRRSMIASTPLQLRSARSWRRRRAEARKGPPLPQRVAAIDHEGGAGDIARSRRRGINRKWANFLRVAGAAHRNRADERLDHQRIFLDPRPVGLGHEETWADGVD